MTEETLYDRIVWQKTVSLENFCTPQHALLLDAWSCDAQQRREIVMPVFI